MEPSEPDKLDYATPADDQGDDGVRRYYREPPEFENLVVIAVCALVVLTLMGIVSYLIFRDRF